MTDSLHLRESEISHYCRMKSYPDGVEIIAANRPVFREPGFELSDKWGSKKSEVKREKPSVPVDTDRARRRAASAVRDLVLCNDFRYFVTLTLDKEKIERYEISEIVKHLRVWLDNAVRRQGLKYVLVPEYHKDKAIHFHGFFNDALPVIPAGVTDGHGHPVFNLPSWTYGFTTAIEIYGDYQKATAYICKYVRKSSEKIGGRWYFHGGKLNKPDISYPDLTLTELLDSGENVYQFSVPEGRLSFGIIRREGGVFDGVQKLPGVD